MLFDSVEKVVINIGVVTNESFEYGGKEFTPKPVRVSTGLGRGITCPPNCGGCCLANGSLDYLPDEPHPDITRPRVISFNGKEVWIHSVLQTAAPDAPYCRFLRLDDGRCTIHTQHPFLCDFELIRFSIRRVVRKHDGFSPPIGADVNSRLFGRGWRLNRVDGGRGALCEMLEPTEAHVVENIRKFQRMQDWANHLGVKETKIPEIIDYLQSRSFSIPRIIL